MTSAEEVIQVLSSVKDSGSGKSALELGWLDQIRVNPPKAILRMNLPGFAQSQRDRIVKEIRNLLLQFSDIKDVQIEIGNQNENQAIGQAGHGQVSPLQSINGVKNIVAISSGKGGVGKSTVAVNLACALAKKGFTVGLLDADIYGPNTPIMLGVEEKTPIVKGSGTDQQIIPIESYGIAMVSMGFLIDKDQPVIWRGPMLNGIIRQFLYQVSWEERDFLVVDLPPGTGDAQLSLAQAVPMTGVLIVTTPQKVSLQDARRGLAMFKQMNVPVLGVIENMTAFVPPDFPDKRYELFGNGGGEILAKENELPLLAKIPLEMHPSKDNPEGMPIVESQINSLSSKEFLSLASYVVEYVQEKSK